MLENIKITDGKASVDISKASLQQRVTRLTVLIAELDIQATATAEKKADLVARRTTLEGLVVQLEV